MNQPTLFESASEKTTADEVALYALGDFQSRGLVLAGRELPLDRLLGAFRRAADRFQIDELTDEQIAGTLERLGANVKRLPSFVAKHPFRVTVSNELAERSKLFFDNAAKPEKSKQ
jgi:hypothetical protein